MDAGDRIQVCSGEEVELRKLPCLVCGGPADNGFLFEPNALDLPAISYALCQDHIVLAGNNKRLLPHLQRAGLREALEGQ